MRKVAFLLFTAAALQSPLIGLAVDAPRGTVVELHSCEVYAGGCIVSSQATLEGRYLLRGWHFSGGSYGGEDFAGLAVATLETSSENLAAPGAVPGATVVYLPESANRSQRAALLAWVKGRQPAPAAGQIETREVPLQFERVKDGYALEVPGFLSVQTRPLKACDWGGCGEALWYEPQVPVDAFAVAVNHRSEVNEPFLDLKWNDAGKRSVFLATFGRLVAAAPVYVSATDLCGSAETLF